jgi:hypothetical protein
MAATACLERYPCFFGFGNWAEKENSSSEKGSMTVGPVLLPKRT